MNILHKQLNLSFKIQNLSMLHTVFYTKVSPVWGLVAFTLCRDLLRSSQT